MLDSILSDEMLALDHISKSFGNVRAVKSLSFQVKRGEVFGLLGPNGAGKTTAIKMILGLLEPDAGQLSVLGLDPQKDEIEMKQRVGYIAEEPLIYKSLTPRELFNFIASVRGMDSDLLSPKLAEYMESLDALEYYNRLISTLSRGNKQKIQIIASLLHDPELLIMDEPLSGLDAKSVRVVKEMIQLHLDRGGSVIFSTHIMEVAEDLCDRICILNKGQAVVIGSFEELQAQANEVGASLEDIFLKLTDEDGAMEDIASKLRNTMVKY